MREMRRKDREVTDEARIDEIISRCNCCRIGFNDSGEVHSSAEFWLCEAGRQTYLLLSQCERGQEDRPC